METIIARNAHQALPLGVQLLDKIGLQRDSRNGPVKVSPQSVTTTYKRPLERIVFWPERDYNPAFVLYEALWMLAGRNDVQPLTRYVRDFGQYSDDGEVLHGAYGHRWRAHFEFDQLAIIAARLRNNPTDRRSVLAMWDPTIDLVADDAVKDIPCNDVVSFQRDADGRLDMTVFCRSNDILWGAYYANAFHFGMLLEYMAHWIGCEVGIYEQVSINYHAYLSTLEPLKPTLLKIKPERIMDPYASGVVKQMPIRAFNAVNDVERLDEIIDALLADADAGFIGGESLYTDPWSHSIYCVLKAHHAWRVYAAPERFQFALKALENAPHDIDWIASMRQWIMSRFRTWEQRMKVPHA